MAEEFRTIDGFPNYEVSNFGNVKSLNYNRTKKPKILKACIDSSGYYNVNIGKTKRIHKLVAIAFLNHVPEGRVLVVNHIDFNRLNNNVSNIEIVTTRENSNQKHLKSSSKYTGVSWCKKSNKWKAEIRIKCESKYLGIFTDELDASNAYKKALKYLETIK